MTKTFKKLGQNSSCTKLVSGVTVRQVEERQPSMIVKNVASNLTENDFKLKMCQKYNLSENYRVVTKLRNKFDKDLCSFVKQICMCD